jgi:hypothetical protein
MDQHRLHAERVSHEAGVLACRTPERVKEILRHVVAALDGDLLDRVRHVLHGDGQEALGHLLGRFALGLGNHAELFAHDRVVERLVLAGAEDTREECGAQLAQHDVRVGDGQRPAAAVAGGAGVRARAVGTGAETARIGVEDRSAARRDRMDAHHRRADAHARHLGVERALVVARVMRDVRRGAAHIEADDLPEAGIRRRLDHADDAARGTGEDRVLALKLLGRRHAARRHHELERRAVFARRGGAQRVRHARDVAAEDRREIGVDHRGVAAAHELHQRADLVADGDLAKAHGAHRARKRDLVLRVLPGVHQHDGDRVDAVRLRLFQLVAQWVGVERALHRAVGHEALVHLDHLFVELLGQDDLLGEDVRPRLVGDPERVAETLRDQQKRPVALPLQERVGRDRRAHLHRADAGGVDLAAKRAADALDRGILVGAGVLGEKLQRVQRTVRRAAHDVGEGAAAIDPEVPAPGRRCVLHRRLPEAAAHFPGSPGQALKPCRAIR